MQICHCLRLSGRLDSSEMNSPEHESIKRNDKILPLTPKNSYSNHCVFSGVARERSASV